MVKVYNIGLCLGYRCLIVYSKFWLFFQIRRPEPRKSTSRTFRHLEGHCKSGKVERQRRQRKAFEIKMTFQSSENVLWWNILIEFLVLLLLCRLRWVNLVGFSLFCFQWMTEWIDFDAFKIEKRICEKFLRRFFFWSDKNVSRAVEVVKWSACSPSTPTIWVRISLKSTMFPWSWIWKER